jgi:hypothetical protein
MIVKTITTAQSTEMFQSKPSGGLNQKEIERLRCLIGKLDKPSGTCSSAYSGKFPFSIGLNVSDVTFATSWIMDSRTTDHMIHSPNVFTTSSPCPSSRKIATADGSLTIVAGIGSVQINLLLTLQNVLHVPKLTGSNIHPKTC